MRQLTSEEMRKLDDFNKENQVDARDLMVFELRMRLLQAEMQLRQEQTKVREYELRDLREKMADRKTAREVFTKELREKYEIKSEKWGYDPETGELREDPVP